MLHSLSNVCFGEAAGGAVELSQGPLWAVRAGGYFVIFPDTGLWLRCRKTVEWAPSSRSLHDARTTAIVD